MRGRAQRDRIGIIAGGRRYLSIDDISRLNNRATPRICMRIGSLVRAVSARDNGTAYLRGRVAIFARGVASRRVAPY